jgi:hypothetical protein
VRPFTLPAGLVGSAVKSGSAATAQVVLSVTKNDVQVGTLTIAAAGTTATPAAASQTAFVAGDVLEVVAPATQDATFSDPLVTLAGLVTV